MVLLWKRTNFARLASLLKKIELKKDNKMLFTCQPMGKALMVLLPPPLMDAISVIVLSLSSPLPSPLFLSRKPPPPLHLASSPPPTPTQTKFVTMRAWSLQSFGEVKRCEEPKPTTTKEGIYKHRPFPFLAITSTDLPSPSFLFSHFTGRYRFPVLFFLLHVLVGSHLFLIQ